MAPGSGGSASWNVAEVVVPAKGEGEDRVAAVLVPDGVVLAIADGAGGLGGGGRAADAAVREITVAARGGPGRRPDWCAALLMRIDTAVLSGSGECALVVAHVFGTRVVGASVGDCAAWLIGEAIDDLTAGQVRKPLIGSGSSTPVTFDAPLRNATLLLASDGLWKYAPRERIGEFARQPDLKASAREIARLPRLRSGALPDDVAVLLCRAEDV